MHLEDLWNLLETKEKDLSSDKLKIISELIININLYKKIEEYDFLAINDKKIAKEKVLAKIFANIAYLTLTDNINIYQVLKNYLSSEED